MDKKKTIKIKIKKNCDLENKIKPQNKELFKARVRETKFLVKEFSTNLPSGKYLYVVLKKNKNKILVSDKKNEKTLKMKHHVIADAKNVSIAGELRIDKKRRFFFDNNSGHYQPDPKCLNKIMRLTQINYNLEYVNQKTKQLKNSTRKTLEMKIRN